MNQLHLIELSSIARKDAIASLQRYAEENLAETLGELPANLLLSFILEEIGPAVYNRALQDAQARLQLRVADLSAELYVEEFQYWPRADAKAKRRR